MPRKMLLNKLQNNFAKHIFNRKAIAITSSLPYSNQEALARLNIYRNNVFGNFYSVLSSIYAVVKKIVGEKKFKKFVEEYQNKYHSTNGNLDNYGDKFPLFLKKQEPGFLSDLAQLELYYHQCYFAREVENFDIKKFQKLAPEKFFDLKFELHPSCFLMKSEFAIFSIWKKEAKKNIKINKPEFALIERVYDSCQIHKLSEVEFIFLDNLTKKKTLYFIYQKISKLAKEEFDIGQIMNRFIANKVISKIL